jgi:hypothetical protein
MTEWQWQLTGEIDTSVDAEMFDVDLFDVSQETIITLHSEGKRVVCYFSAGTYEPWRPDASDFPPEIVGNEVEGWEDERWLNVKRIDLLGPIMERRLDLAVEKGCDGVEPDNVDAWSFDADGDPENDTGFNITAEDQAAYNIWLSQRAHERGLSVGLKNDLEQVSLLEPYFDWALNEECFYYGECELLLPFVENGKAVFVVEYVGEDGEVDEELFREWCAEAERMRFSLLMKRKEVDAWRRTCEF